MRPYRATPIDKPVDSGEFVYGYLIAYEGYSFIFSYKDKKGFIHSFIEVHPETVGQQIGKVCHYTKKEIYGGMTMRSRDGLRKYTVTYSDIFCRWYLKGLGKAWEEPQTKWNNYEIIIGKEN